MTYYDEIFTKDGAIRPHYARIYDLWSSIPAKERRALHEKSKPLFSGDYFQDPLPRILTREEIRELRAGVHQRARAILAFLRDYCTRGKRWRRVMSEATLLAVIERHHPENILRKIDPDLLAFPYGPDIIRDLHGRWRIVEDSAGVIGGLGDLARSRDILYRLMPGLRAILKEDAGDPLEYLEQLARYFYERDRKSVV